MFENDPEIIDLGRMAIFFLPATKLQKTASNGHTHEQNIDEALTHRFQGFTKQSMPWEGHYRMGSEVVRDNPIRYEVSFKGKNKVREFVALLKTVCREIGEESMYLTMGENSYLVKPNSEPSP